MGPSLRPSDSSRELLSTAHHTMRAAVERQIDTSPADQLPCSPPEIPEHELLQRIGHGAYGEVWLARNALGALRAVKIVYRARFEEERPYRREFKGILKYEPVSRTHEGLVAVLHAGRNEEAGYYYYVMELADPVGQYLEALTPISKTSQPAQNTAAEVYIPRTLRTEMQQRRRLPPQEAAAYAERIASALAHLHDNGLVHRDIKPGNVIFVGGKPKLADLGLVAVYGEARSFVGTAGFIPPEGPGTPRADIYAMGKLLYELATGRDRMEFPQLPAGIQDETESLLELNEVITRACAPAPSDRYASAAQLQADLNLFLAGRSLREVSRVGRNLKLLKRVAAVAGVIVVLALLGLWMARDKARHAAEREQVAQAQASSEMKLRQRAEAAERGTQQQLYTALLEQARATVLSGEQGQRSKALEAIRRAAAITNSAELRREALAALALPDLVEEQQITMPSGQIRALDPAFERVATCSGTNPLQILSLPDNRLLMQLPSPAQLLCSEIWWDREGTHVAVAREHGENQMDVEVWNTKTGQLALHLQGVPQGAVAFHPKLTSLLCPSSNIEAASWDIKNQSVARRIKMPAQTDRLSFSADGTKLAASWRDDKGRWEAAAFDLDSGMMEWAHVFPDRVSALEWDPSGKWLAITDHDSTVQLADASSGDLYPLGSHKFQAVSAAFTADGQYLLTGGWEREVICWDVLTKRKVFVVSMAGFVVSAAAAPDRIALGNARSIHLFRMAAPVGPIEFAKAVGGRIHHAAFSHNGRWLAATGADRLVLWDVQSRHASLLAANAREARLFFSPDDQELYASRDDHVFGWRLDASPGTNFPQWAGISIAEPRDFTSFCLCPEGGVITSAGGSQVLARDALRQASGICTPTISGVNSASGDGKWLAIFAPFTTRLFVYSLPQLQLSAVLTNDANVHDFRFSLNGDLLAVSCQRGVDVWTTRDWKLARRFPNFIDLLHTPESDRVWLTQDYRTAGLYDAATLKLLLPLATGTLPIALSDDGRWLATSVDARRLQVWDLAKTREQLHKLNLDWTQE